MIAITDKVSNVIVEYNDVFNTKFRIGDIPTSYQTPEEFVADMKNAIAEKTPVFGGFYNKDKKSK